MEWMSEAFFEKTKAKLAEKYGFVVTEGKHIHERDPLDSSSIENRLEDLHEAFADPEVHLISTIRGGFASNHLLPFLDFDLVRNNPKILCGFSDITALQNAIFAKTGLVTYSGPNFYLFGFDRGMEETVHSFEQCLMSNQPMELAASREWTTNHWYESFDGTPAYENSGHWVLREGGAEGTILGGNLCTLQLLHGTPWMPDLEGSILFLEDDAEESRAVSFDRNLQSLLHQPGFKGVRGIVIGRFLKSSDIDRAILTHIIATKPQLKGIPVIANVDFGHTLPMITFPIGGTVRISAKGERAEIIIVKH